MSTSSLFDAASPAPEQTLLDELEILDKALLEGDATEEQQNRGLEIVDLCNDAPRLKAEVERLTRELETERTYRQFLEKELGKKRNREFALKNIDDVYKSLKRQAEQDVQDPIDEHYRKTLEVLRGLHVAVGGLPITAREGPFNDAIMAAERALGEEGAA